MSDPDKLVTLKTFVYPSEALPIMARLQAEGIECYLDGDNTVSVQPFYSQAIGGVKLNIKLSDAERAIAIIKQNELYRKEENEGLKDGNEKKSFTEKGYDIKVEAFCPKCESSKIFRKKFPFYKTALIILLTGLLLLRFWIYMHISILLFCTLLIPLLFINRKRYCANCGHEWGN
jgi:hypothetical protein